MVTAEKILPDEFYDEEDSFQGLAINPDLTRRERKEAEFWRPIVSGGVMLVTGKQGSGKDLFATSLTWLCKRYFRKRALLDFKPRRLFGEYTLFNTRVMLEEIGKMSKTSNMDELSTDEFVDRSQVLFQGSILYLSELKRYCYNREPHNPVNKYIGKLCTVYRHLDLFIVGTHVTDLEIDYKTFLRNVGHHADCVWDMAHFGSTKVTLRRGSYVSDEGVFDATFKKIIIRVDGKTPRRVLMTPFTRYSLTKQGEKKKLNSEFLSYLSDKPKTALEIATHFNARVEDANDTLYQLVAEDLVKGNRFFDLYNSKALVNLKPIIRKQV